MTETAPPVTVNVNAPADAKTGFFTRLEDKILPRAEQDATRALADVTGLFQDHAAAALDVAGDFISLVKLIDPGDAVLAASASALLPKVLGMAETVARDASAALHRTAPAS